MKRLFKPINLLWALLLPVVYIAIRVFPWRDIFQILLSLTVPEVAIILGLNGLILFLFCARWWLILRAYGYSIPYPKLSGYRMAGYAISYFTPGTQFGGEPLQAYLVHSRHATPVDVSVAAVTIDKALELFANFSFLAIGIFLTTSFGLIPGLSHPGLAGWIWLFLIIPVVYGAALYLGRFPISAVVDRLPTRVWFHPLLKKLPPFVSTIERQIAFLLRRRPWLILWALLISSLVWCLMVLEYGLMAAFLGAHLSPLQVVAGYTATRLAFLTPLPGGVGLLEAGQVVALQAFGFSSALGLSLSLLIRARDLTIGLFGLWVGSMAGARSEKIEKSNQEEPAIRVGEPEPVLIDRS